MPTTLNPTHDPLGRDALTSAQFNPAVLPADYPGSYCQCQQCITRFTAANMVPQSTYNPANYRPSNESRALQAGPQIGAWLGLGDDLGHPAPPSRWAHHEHETPLPEHLRALIISPMKYMLRRGGRVWSAEVEVNEIRPRTAAAVLSCEVGSYSTRPNRNRIIACDDATVDAEIKLSCFRDGAGGQARQARETYSKLYDAGARCAHNAGHHVHVDATRLADMGMDEARLVMSAVNTITRVCQHALIPLAASGYQNHRGQSINFATNSRALSGRAAVHGARLGAAARAGSDENATIEYRVPNATLEPVRAQSYIGYILAALDFAERALLDDDLKAVTFLEQAEDRLRHANPFDEVLAAEFLGDALLFSRDTRKALAVAAITGPCSPEHAEVWRRSAELPKPLVVSVEEDSEEGLKAAEEAAEQTKRRYRVKSAAQVMGEVLAGEAARELAEETERAEQRTAAAVEWGEVSTFSNALPEVAEMLGMDDGEDSDDEEVIDEDDDDGDGDY